MNCFELRAATEAAFSSMLIGDKVTSIALVDESASTEMLQITLSRGNQHVQIKIKTSELGLSQ